MRMTRSATPPRKRGRPSKGARVGFHAVMPTAFRAELESIAATEALPMGAIVTRFVAAGLDRPAPEYCLPPKAVQAELPAMSPGQRTQRNAETAVAREHTRTELVGLHVSLPAEFRPEIESLAAQDRLPMGAIITRFVAAGLHQPGPDYCQPKPQDQEELPLAEAS